MQIVLIVVGAIIGSALMDLGRAVFGLAIGGLLGWLIGRNRSHLKQIKMLEAQVRQINRPQPQQAASAPTASDPAPLTPPPDDPSPPDEAAQPSPPSQALETSAGPAIEFDAAPQSPGFSRASAPVARTTNASQADSWGQEPSAIERLARATRTWLTTGNVPVKLGVVVSFFGVAFLLKYAVEQQLVSLPLEFRYLGIGAAAMALLGVGWRLRRKQAVYALSLQGGGIGILFLTLFAAFRLHNLMPAPLAFALLIGLTVSAGVLAVAQNARSLAVLGLVGGFLAPVLISTGSGNHVGLFSYYLLLNAAVLGIAWYRSWRFLNVLAFVFTFGVGAAWGVRSYEPSLLASTEPFLIIFFLFFTAIAVLFAWRQPPQLKGLVDGTLVFGTPVIAFALQSEMVKHTEFGLTLSAISVAVFYSLTAFILSRVQGRHLTLLIESFVALSVAFATIAVPLALDDRWTAVAWALEGAALIWVGVRQNGILARLSGTALLLGSGAVFLDRGWIGNPELAMLNGNYLGGTLIGLASLFSARYLDSDRRPVMLQKLMAVGLLVWGLLWFGGTGIAEILDHAPRAFKAYGITAFVALSGAAMALVARRLNWLAGRYATLAYLPVLTLIAGLYLLDRRLAFASLGLLAWPLAAAAHLVIMKCLDPIRSRFTPIWHSAGLLLFTAVAALDMGRRLELAEHADLWVLTASLGTVLLVGAAVLALRSRFTWPLQRYWTGYLGAVALMVCLTILMTGAAGIDIAGDPTPLPYVPLLNPLDLLMASGVVLALKLIQIAGADTGLLTASARRIALISWTGAALLLTTQAVVRGVHHLADVPWSQSALSQSVSVQSALSIYWAILGFGAMIWGARRGQRWIWLAGTGLMTLVVAKLFLVDLGNTGTVARIVSFLGVGALLLVVGYMAPAPPRVDSGGKPEPDQPTEDSPEEQHQERKDDDEQ